MQKRAGLGLIAGLAIIVAACGGGATPTPAPAETPAPTAEATAEPTPEPTASPAAALCDAKLKVGLVTDVGRVNDKGFNQSAYEGMESAKEAAPSCFETDYIETTSQSDYAKNIAEFADNGYDVIIGVGFLLGDAMGDAAKEYPDAKFISIDGAPGTGHDESWMTNGESLFYAEDEAGYLAGVLAGVDHAVQHDRRRRRSPRGAAGRAVRRGLHQRRQGDQVRHHRQVHVHQLVRRARAGQGGGPADDRCGRGRDLRGRRADRQRRPPRGVRRRQAGDRRRHRPVLHAPRGRPVPRLERHQGHRHLAAELAAPYRGRQVHPWVHDEQRGEPWHRPRPVPRQRGQGLGRGGQASRRHLRRPRGRLDQDERRGRRQDGVALRPRARPGRRRGPSGLAVVVHGESRREGCR
ncbi:MAG: BMP family ABC transporter substrate-binding protein [Comamonadaceae bacterium]|nr:BMP family ABC transporter substrate-binding protein [Comamonadaceae bacterium]